MMQMSQDKILQTIRQYLPQVIHMSLATVRDNKPWVSEVHFSYDDDLNLYFVSLPNRRHSEEIADNPHVAGNIVTQHALNQKVRGVYFEGTAEKLGDVDKNHPAFVAAHGRFNTPLKALEDYDVADKPKFYKITVSDWYLYDAYEASPSQKFHLPWAGRG